LLACKTWGDIKAEDWQFQIDKQTVPEWFEKKCVKYTAKAFEAWNQSILIHLLPGNETIEALREGGYIAEMWGTSKVGEMWGTSKVGEMWGTSKVGEMWATSQVGEMYSFASAVKNSKLYTAKDVVVVQSGCVEATN
jgi:hypothetical protein